MNDSLWLALTIIAWAGAALAALAACAGLGFAIVWTIVTIGEAVERNKK